MKNGKGTQRRAKEEPYKIKNDAGMKIMRIILWTMLGFVFLRGAINILQPTDQKKVESTIDNFRREFARFKGDNEEMMAFAQNFAREYLTYQEKGEKDYKNRIRPYVADRLYHMQDMISFQGNAEVVYASAYRKEQYSDRQYDVYVLAEVDYGSYRDKTTLRVPVYTEGGAYIVESIPMVVSDSLLLANYAQTEYKGTQIPDSELVSLQVSLNNFFKAYYEEKADVIEYYLSKKADRTRMMGLYGRYAFQELVSLKAYREEGTEKITGIVTLKLKDRNNENVCLQELNVTVVNSDGRYYIEDMNTKTGNLTNSQEKRK